MESVGKAAKSFFGVFIKLLLKGVGSKWQSTSIVSDGGSSLSQFLWLVGFSEKRRCWLEIFKCHVLTLHSHGNNWTYILITRRNIFCTFCFTTQHTLRSIASNELDGIKSATFRWHEYCRVYSRTLTSFRYNSWWLFYCRPRRMNVLFIN